MHVVQGDPAGAFISPNRLAYLLRLAADEIDRGGSMEGSIAWETPEKYPDIFEVVAAYRTGNDQGQGGFVLVNRLTHPYVP